ncbi:MAG: hypothetical protein ACI9LF_000138, partial [Flavobacteriales bacterium]
SSIYILFDFICIVRTWSFFLWEKVYRTMGLAYY